MKKINRKNDVIGSLLPDSGLVLAAVGLDNMSTGEPVINFVFPVFPENLNGVDFPQIKYGLRERCVIVRFFSPDGSESIEVRVTNEDALYRSERPKKKKTKQFHSVEVK